MSFPHVYFWTKEKKFIRRAGTAPFVFGIPIDCGSESLSKNWVDRRHQLGGDFAWALLGLKKGVLIQGHAGGRPDAMNDMFVNLQEAHSAGMAYFGARDNIFEMGFME